MGNRKKDILRKMKIVYMSEGLNTIDDLTKSTVKRLSMESKRQSIELKRLSSIEAKRILKESKEKSVSSKTREKRQTSESSSVASSPSQSSNSSKASVQKKLLSTSLPLKLTKKGKVKLEKAEVKPKFENLLKNLPLSERRLFHARNGIPYKVSDGYDELDVDYSSTVALSTKQLNDFTDVNEGEQKIMNMWNNHTMKFMGRSFQHLPKILEGFIKDKGREIVEERLFRNAILMITSFHHNGILDAVDCLTAKSQLQIHVAEYMKYQQSPNTSSSSLLSHGVQTSTFYGSTSIQSITAQTPNFRRSLDDHLPCRRSLSPEEPVSRTLSLDTRVVDDDDRPRTSRMGRSRLNSKGGGGAGGSSPGRGSPVRGKNLTCNQTKAQLDAQHSSSITNTSTSEVANSSLGNYRRSVIMNKRGSTIRKGLWQGDTSERTNKASESSDSSTVDKTSTNRLSLRLQDSSSLQSLPCNPQSHSATGIQPLSSNNGIQAHCAHKQQIDKQKSDFYDKSSTKRKQDSPTAIENFLEAFDHKIENSSSTVEDIESNLPVFVVVPKSKKRREMDAKESENSVSKNPNQKENISEINQEYANSCKEQRLDDCDVIQQVYSSQRTTSRSKTN